MKGLVDSRARLGRGGPVRRLLVFFGGDWLIDRAASSDCDDFARELQEWIGAPDP